MITKHYNTYLHSLAEMGERWRDFPKRLTKSHTTNEEVDRIGDQLTPPAREAVASARPAG